MIWLLLLACSGVERRSEEVLVDIGAVPLDPRLPSMQDLQEKALRGELLNRVFI